MAWQPQQQGLDEVLAMLRQTSSPDSEVQKNITVVSACLNLAMPIDGCCWKTLLLCAPLTSY